LGQPAHSSTGPSADGGVEQQQQGQGQLSGRPSQQDRRRVPHQTVGVYGSQQMQSVSAAAAPLFAVTFCCAVQPVERTILGVAVHACSQACS
jgi:hypothetical protein